MGLVAGLALSGIAEAAQASALAGAADSVAARVAQAGFENVAAVVLSDSLVALEYENRIYRDPLRALGRVADLASQELDPEVFLTLVQLGRGVPVLDVGAAVHDWRDFLAGRIGSAEFRSRVRVRDGADTPRGPRGKRRSPAWLKVDAALRPLAEFQLGVPDDPFQYGVWLAPELTTLPFEGALVTAQGVV